ncbi:MAG: ATP-binding protein [Candidatus Acidiferrales bacterium]
MKESERARWSNREEPRGSCGGTVKPGALAPVQFEYDPSFRALFDASAEALVVIDSQGVLQRANRRASELLRLKNTSLQQTDLDDFLARPLGFGTTFTQPSLLGGHACLDGLLATGFPVRITLRTVLPVSRHLVLCLEEGSVVYRAERMCRQADAELRSVLDSVPTGVIVLDPAGRLRFANARFAQFLGLGPRNVSGIDDFDELEQLVAGRFSDPKAFSAPWRAFARGEGGPAHDELEITLPARRVLERFSRPVLDAEGCGAGWIELYTDVTGERQAQRQIQSKMLQTERLAALGQFVSGIAHELNNPLTAIMGYAQLLLRHSLMQPQLSEANKVFQEAERARHIVKNLLYFARENKPERTRVHLNEIVERTLALRSYELKVENILVECELDPDLPATMADPHQLQQVVLNLLVNSEQALLEGRGQGRIWMRTRLAPGRRICLEISDDGPGIPLEIAPRIFDPFFTTKPPGVGTGLGLSIVYGIVQQHDGEVIFDSHRGAGAKFVVELPVVPAAQDDNGSRPSLAPDRGSLSVPAGRVLVVEDEPAIAQLIADVLREESHSVDAVLDSQEGLTRLSRARYDIVICDLRMPRLDGPAFYDALVRTASPLQDHILFITGDTLSPRTQKFLESHRAPCLAKPFLVEELKLAVHRLLVARSPHAGEIAASSLPEQTADSRN